MLLRICGRRAAHELDDLEEFCDTVFPNRGGSGLDLRPSVYSIDHQVVQAHAEHTASAGANPPRGGWHFDLTDLGQPPVATDLGGWFDFTRRAHREFAFESEEQIREMAVTLLAAREARRIVTLKEDLKAYVRDRLTAHDFEWERALQGASQGREMA